jgi:hypothetical protein
LNRQQIKEIFLANGFKEKLQERGLLNNVYDLNPYVYVAAGRLLEAFLAELKAKIAEDLRCDPDKGDNQAGYNLALDDVENWLDEAMADLDLDTGLNKPKARVFLDWEALPEGTGRDALHLGTGFAMVTRQEDGSVKAEYVPLERVTLNEATTLVEIDFDKAREK